MADTPHADRGDEELLEQEGMRTAPSAELAARHRRLMAMLRRMHGEAWSADGATGPAEAPER